MLARNPSQELGYTHTVTGALFLGWFTARFGLHQLVHSARQTLEKFLAWRGAFRSGLTSSDLGLHPLVYWEKTGPTARLGLGAARGGVGILSLSHPW